MKNRVKSLVSNPLISGSFFVFSGGILANLFNFLFNLYMSRNLRVEEYGVLISLISIITLLSIPAGAFTPTILTVAGKHYANNDFSHLHAFYYKMLKPLVFLGAILLLVFVIFSLQIGKFFHIQNTSLLIISALSVFLVYISTLHSTFLQAKLSFRILTFTTTASAILKVLFGIVLIMIGWGLGGAIAGLVISFALPVVVGIFYLWKVIMYKSEIKVKLSSRELIAFGIPSAIIIFCLNSYITSDILLVKHLFSELQAGQYAGLSLIGRVIFFLTAPISTVMFPILINKVNTNADYRGILFGSIFVVGAFSFAVTIFYFMFPEFTIFFFLKNPAYLAVSEYVGRFGIFITIYSIVSILTYYFLSIKKTQIMWILLVGAIIQAVLIYIFHKDFYQVINVSTSIQLAILIVLLFYLKSYIFNKST